MGLLGGLLGGIGGFLVGGPAGAAIGAGLGSSMEGKKGGGGGGGGGGPMDPAYIAALNNQTQAGIRQAEIAAAASRDVANAQLAGMKAQADATIKSANSAAMGGIIGAALGAHTTHEEIKQMLPVEVGAANIQSWELAERWNTTMNMRQAGYQDVAIEYALSGYSGKALYKDPRWNALSMAQTAKQDMLAAAQMFGIQSKQNPTGVAITWEDWQELHSFRRPEDILKVDQQVQRQRQQEFAQWEQAMRAQGKGIIVDLYKNPQLGGQSLIGMKGKDPMIPPELAGLLGSLAGGSGGAGMNLGSLTQGETTQHTAAINELMKNGVVDKYGMVNGGALLAMVPEHLRTPPPFEVTRQMSQGEMVKLQDQYNMLMNKTVDPKLVRFENQGFGVTKQILLNPDGSMAHSVLTGYMTNAMGETIPMVMNGTRLQEWYDRQSMIDGMGPTFPGMFAPRSNQEIEGVRTPKNYMSQSRNAVQQQPSASMRVNFAENPYAQQNQLGGPSRTPQAGSSGAAPAPSGGGSKTVTQQSAASSTGGIASSLKGASTPQGYEGAPLAAGE